MSVSKDVNGRILTLNPSGYISLLMTFIDKRETNKRLTTLYYTYNTKARNKIYICVHGVTHVSK